MSKSKKRKLMHEAKHDLLEAAVHFCGEDFSEYPAFMRNEIQEYQQRIEEAADKIIKLETHETHIDKCWKRIRGFMEDGHVHEACKEHDMYCFDEIGSSSAKYCSCCFNDQERDNRHLIIWRHDAFFAIGACPLPLLRPATGSLIVYNLCATCTAKIHGLCDAITGTNTLLRNLLQPSDLGHLISGYLYTAAPRCLEC